MQGRGQGWQKNEQTLCTAHPTYSLAAPELVPQGLLYPSLQAVPFIPLVCRLSDPETSQLLVVRANRQNVGTKRKRLS